jgi:hypothetical protein
MQRATAKEEKKRFKAEKRAEREQQAAQRVLIKAQHRQEIEDRKQQRAQAKEMREATILARKRQEEVNGENSAPKRRRLNHLQALTKQSTQNLTSSTPQHPILMPETAINRPQSSFSTSEPAEEVEEAISRQSRCGRRVKLPTRYK